MVLVGCGEDLVWVVDCYLVKDVFDFDLIDFVSVEVLCKVKVDILVYIVGYYSV